MTPAPQRENIYDLTARESARVGLPHAELLIEAFEAVRRGELLAHFDEIPSTYTHLPHAGVWRASLKQAVAVLRSSPHFFVGWFRTVLLDLSEFQRWCNENERSRGLPRARRLPRASAKRVHAVVKAYMDGERVKGRVGSQKRAWECAKAKLPGARYQQVIDALAAVEGSKKTRGRPRTSRGKES